MRKGGREGGREEYDDTISDACNHDVPEHMWISGPVLI